MQAKGFDGALPLAGCVELYFSEVSARVSPNS